MSYHSRSVPGRMQSKSPPAGLTTPPPQSTSGRPHPNLVSQFGHNLVRQQKQFPILSALSWSATSNLRKPVALPDPSVLLNPPFNVSFRPPGRTGLPFTADYCISLFRRFCTHTPAHLRRTPWVLASAPRTITQTTATRSPTSAARAPERLKSHTASLSHRPKPKQSPMARMLRMRHL